MDSMLSEQSSTVKMSIGLITGGLIGLVALGFCWLTGSDIRGK